MSRKTLSVIFFGLCLVILAVRPAFPADLPWYKRIWNRMFDRASEEQLKEADATPAVEKSSETAPPEEEPLRVDEEVPQLTPHEKEMMRTPIRELKESPSDLTVDDSAVPSRTLTSDGYEGPDLSEERTPADEHLKRKFPMPKTPIPEPPRTPPTIDQYRVPEVPRTGTED